MLLDVRLAKPKKHDSTYTRAQTVIYGCYDGVKGVCVPLILKDLAVARRPTTVPQNSFFLFSIVSGTDGSF